MSALYRRAEVLSGDGGSPGSLWVGPEGDATKPSHCPFRLPHPSPAAFLLAPLFLAALLPSL